MEKLDIENKLKELKGQQSDYFKNKKADRDPAVIEGIRSEINELKSKVNELYKPKKAAKAADKAE